MRILTLLGPAGRALAEPNYFAYSAGNAVSMTGFWVQRAAMAWLVWTLTGSYAWLGILVMADMLPAVAIAPFAGAISDRVNKFNMVLVSQALALVQAAVLAAMTAFGWIDEWSLLALVFFLGIVIAFNQPARMAIVSDLVRAENFASAIAVNALVFNITRFIGPAIGGVVIVRFGIWEAFALNALSYAVFLYSLWQVRGIDTQPAARSESRFLRDVMDGFVYVLRHPGIGPMLLILFIVNACARSVGELLPGFAEDVFHRGAEGLSWLMSAGGLGGLVGSAILSARGGTAGLTRLVLGSVIGVIAMLVLFVATANYWVGLASFFLASIALALNGVGSQTLIQSSIARDMRGRVLSLYGVTFRTSPALGAFLIGSAAEISHSLAWPVIAALALCGAALVWGWGRRQRIGAGLESPRAAE